MENTLTIGKFLRSSREKKELTLDQVAAKTKININILRDLENDDIENLPNITYVRGFVKNYAKTVGLDPGEAKDLLDKAYKKDEPVEVASEVQSEKISEPVEKSGISPEEAQELKENVISFSRSIFKKKYIIPVVALAIAFVIIKSIVNWVGTLVNEPGKSAVVETETSQTSTKTEETIVPPTPDNTSESAEAPKNNEEDKTVAVREADTEKEPKVVEKVIESEPEATPLEKEPEPSLSPGELPFKRFYKAPASTFTTVPDAPEAEDKNLLPPNIKAAAEDGKENVYIVADEGDTWLSYKVDDEDIKRYVLRKGRRLFLKGDRVLVFIGNFNVTKVFYNNMFVNADTRTGVKSLIFPKEAAKDLVFPLFPSYKGVPMEASKYIERMKKTQE